ncbi:hypothetical protein HZS_7381 [Henneguya salminicola]|nr:hypothetical protein HZS_7381 [Henneguya salminicola]
MYLMKVRVTCTTTKNRARKRGRCKYLSFGYSSILIKLKVVQNYGFNTIENLNQDEIEDLLEDIKVYQKLEQDPNTHIKASKVEDLKEDIFKIFAKKSYEEMENLKNQINARIRGSHDVDFDYWNAVLNYLTNTMAKKRLNQRCTEFLQQVNERKIIKPPTLPIIIEKIPDTVVEVIEQQQEIDPLKGYLNQANSSEFVQMYIEGNYSPPLIENDSCYETITHEVDLRAIVIGKIRNFRIWNANLLKK